MRQYVAQMQLEVLWQRRFQKRSCLELHVESIEESASLEQGTQQLNNCIFRFLNNQGGPPVVQMPAPTTLRYDARSRERECMPCPLCRKHS
jgi:hypothetical protein